MFSQTQLPQEASSQANKDEKMSESDDSSPVRYCRRGKSYPTRTAYHKKMDKMLVPVQEALQKDMESHIFTVGGEIAVVPMQVALPPAASGSEARTAKKQRRASVTLISSTPSSSSSSQSGFQYGEDVQHSVTLRWDSTGSNVGRKCVFPATNQDEIDALYSMIQDCEVASFGYAKQDVIDETYRKAGKMYSHRFSTDYSVLDRGVMYAINQALAAEQGSGLRAELYALNVYSGTNGKFKKHVDSPRSTSQVGSLVVCLPSPHTGGQLAVRHQGREKVYDWGTEKAKNTIQWAAFYSDCEHEVYEVQTGHRITLTYNLYSTNYGPAEMASMTDLIDLSKQFFYDTVKEVLQSPEFLPSGGWIGFTCVHAYPHTAHEKAFNLPASLKGIDMLMYQAFVNFGLRKVAVTAAIDETKLERDSYNDKEYPWSTTIANFLQETYRSDDAIDDEPTIPLADQDYWDRKEVKWLNYGPRDTDMSAVATAFATYGNQPDMDFSYSGCVIIGKLPKPSDRSV